MIFISILIIIFCISIPSINRNISSISFTRITSIILIYAGVLSLNTFYIQSIGSGISIYSGYFTMSPVTQLFDFFIFITASVILISFPYKNLKFSSIFFNNKRGVLSGEKGADYAPYSTLREPIVYSYYKNYSLIILFSILGSSFLISCSDLISIYLSIELQSFGVYILASLFKNSVPATGAGLKYFLLGGLSSCLILLGIGFIYSYTGLTNLDSLYSLILSSSASGATLSPSAGLMSVTSEGVAGEGNGVFLNLLAGIEGYGLEGFTLGLIFILVGLLFKISAAPLHNWSPDVYNDSPTMVTIWLTIMPKLSILILLLELFTGGQLGTIFDFNIFNSESLNNTALTYATTGGGGGATTLFKNLLLFSSLLSLILGTVVGLAQKKIKRLLAYSTISHIGFMLLALAINTQYSIESFLFYIIQYTLTNLNVFLIIITLGLFLANMKIKKNLIKTNISQLRALAKTGSSSAAARGINSVNARSSTPQQGNLDLINISELRNFYYLMPILSISFCICLFSMAGVPPFIGFFSKQFVLYSAVQNGYYFMSFIAILTSVISASYYLKLIKTIHSLAVANQPFMMVSDSETAIEKSEDEAGRDVLPVSGLTEMKEFKTLSPRLLADAEGLCHSILDNRTGAGTRSEYYVISHLQSFTISVLTMFIVLFIMKPSILLNSVQLLTLSLFTI